MEHDLEKARNLKLILTTFEQLSGLKINFHKGEIFFLVTPKTMLTCMPSYLVVGLVIFLLAILVFRFTIRDLPLQQNQHISTV
jgi:hypothetical protein